MKYFIFLICLFLNNCATLSGYRDDQLEPDKTRRLENVLHPNGAEEFSSVMPAACNQPVRAGR